jgi:glycerol-3-phosphate O-acyltransferase
LEDGTAAGGGVIFSIDPSHRLLLAYYANSIAHLSKEITSVHISDLTPSQVAQSDGLLM